MSHLEAELRLAAGAKAVCRTGVSGGKGGWKPEEKGTFPAQ
ncbi:hypothetical protein [Geobacter sp. AOG2]|nr:hypothetical protein [Geobacter sp. AOG2]